VRTEHCFVCGLELEYLDRTRDLTCSVCGSKEPGCIRCPQGHYVCERCHNKGLVSVIEDTALNVSSTNPLEIAEMLMALPELPMLGCQHAHVAAAALMVAVMNEGSHYVTHMDIEEVFRRTARQAIGGYCGLTGVCGILPALGACFSVLLGSKCGRDAEQRLTMKAVTEFSKAIAEQTGPSCCKAYVRASLSAAIPLLKRHAGVSVPGKDTVIECRQSQRHPHGCRKARCPYYRSNGGGTIEEGDESGTHCRT
jgi:hypothetical protein